MSWSDLDLLYLMQQISTVMLWAMVPMFAFSFASPHRRRLVPLSLYHWLVLSAGIAGLCATEALELWSEAPPYLPPVQVGPSPFAVNDLLRFDVHFVWLPLGALTAVLALAGLLRSVRLSVWLQVGFSLYIGCAVTGAVVILEHSHEDTVWSDSFSATRWERVADGMTRDEVHALIGPSLPGPLQPRILPEAEFWVRNHSAGYWGYLVFHDGRVVEKRWWYSD